MSSNKSLSRWLVALAIISSLAYSSFLLYAPCLGPNREDSCPTWTENVNPNVSFLTLIAVGFLAFAGAHFWAKTKYRNSIRTAITAYDFKSIPMTAKFLTGLYAVLELFFLLAGFILSGLGVADSQSWGFLGFVVFAVLGISLVLQIKLPSSWKEIERQSGRGKPTSNTLLNCPTCGGTGTIDLIVYGLGRMNVYCTCRYRRMGPLVRRIAE